MKKTIHKMKTSGFGKFTICSRDVLNDETLSLQAKGLYAFLLGLPDNWKLRKSELKRHSANEKDGTDTAFAELVAYGLIIQRRCAERPNLKNQFDYFVFATLKQAKQFSVRGFPDNGISVNGNPDNVFPDNGNSVNGKAGSIEERDTEETFTEEICTEQIYKIEVEKCTDQTPVFTQEEIGDLSEDVGKTEHLPIGTEMLPVDRLKMQEKSIKEPTEQVPYDYAIEAEELAFWSEQDIVVEEEYENYAINAEPESHIQENTVQTRPVRRVSVEEEAVELIAEQFPEEDTARFRELVNQYVQQRANSGQDTIRTARTLAVCAFNFHNGQGAFQDRRIRPVVRRQQANAQADRGFALNQALSFRGWFEERQWFDEKKNAGTKLPGTIYDAVLEWCSVKGGTASRLIGLCMGNVLKEDFTEEEVKLTEAIKRFLEEKFNLKKV